MTDQKPSVGRVVHYYDRMSDNQNKPGPFPAIIAAVHSDTCCTLSVFMPWREAVFVASSNMRKDVAGVDPRNYWEWPPRT